MPTIHLKKASTFLSTPLVCLQFSQLYIKTRLQLSFHYFLLLYAMPTHATNIHPYFISVLIVLLEKMWLLQIIRMLHEHDICVTRKMDLS